MLTACVVVSALVAGCATDRALTGADLLEKYRQSVEVIIEEPEREVVLVDILDRIERKLLELGENNRTFRAELRMLNADYDATREQLDALLADYNESRQAIREGIIMERMAFISLVTAQEWEQLADRDNSMVELWLRENVSDAALKPPK